MGRDDRIGILQVDDPLHAFLRDEVAGRVLGLTGGDLVFDVYRLDPAGRIHWVYRYADRARTVDLVCKFYGTKDLPFGGVSNRGHRAELMRLEFDNLERVRALGFDRLPYRVVRPLASCADINCVLVEEFIAGRDLSHDLAAAIERRRQDGLRDRLAEVAGFLAELHGRSSAPAKVDGPAAAARLGRLARQLAARGTIGPEEENRLALLAERWSAAAVLGSGCKVWVYGDLGPSHFIFDSGPGLNAIDLEILSAADRAQDLGRMMAELKQVFFRGTGDLWASEPYIDHFCAAYHSHLQASTEDFTALMERARYYMGFFEVAIGLNFGLDLGYRRLMIEEAMRCLRI
jgi:aminoglycoside phosphotransferase (APT) family kinase protein